MCGGTATQRCPDCRLSGLSPRVRGNRQSSAPCRCSEGSIPACAGEPLSASSLPRRPWVYPRVCGGTVIGRTVGGVETGLSPRVRGNHDPRGIRQPLKGSIPACAGEPGHSVRQGCRIRVYPRVCGGTSSRAARPCCNTGLSPRVRGNHYVRDTGHLSMGSIPACAGEPLASQAPTGQGGVYPRVCGGTDAGTASQSSAQGLSPRVRGNHQRGVYTNVPHGSIPACAGEPMPEQPLSPARRVYPRVCGGTIRGVSTPMSPMGLSPRVRGNLNGSDGRSYFRGSIPACAGEPST